MFTKNAKTPLIALVLALIITLLLVMTTSADPDVVGLLSLDPANPSAAVGTTVDVDIRLDGITGVYGLGDPPNLPDCWSSAPQRAFILNVIMDEREIMKEFNSRCGGKRVLPDSACRSCGQGYK